ncbi:hypothetical protein FJY90_04495, partial [Candidatus Gottesmanbacteria bacterium]|nr:hypothetical protein [Candidatus Gottesmanbacteria bacterium]
MIFHQLFNKTTVFLFLILTFLLFSFYPTIFELSRAHQLTDPNREFILEHNYYWPDFNLYLSKIRQGFEGHLTAQEKYTSEKHQGSLIQEFYLILGHLGRLLSLDPNFSYQFGRLIFSPLLLLIILMFAKYYFPPLNVRGGQGELWQLLAFLIVIVSGSFPRLYTDSQGILHIGRFMEWWSNIDALQRLTFIPHILFGQVVSFYLLYHLTVNRQQITIKGLLIYILLGNAVGIVFPP